MDRELPGLAGELGFETTHRMLPRRARASVALDRDSGIRLMREAAIREALGHPGVPRVYEVGVADGMPWIADELVTGEVLSGPIAPEQLAVVVRDAATILAHLHRRGVIHDGIWLDAFVHTPERGFPLCLDNWTRARIADPSEGRADIYALGLAISVSLPPTAPRGMLELVDRMLQPDPAARLDAAELASAAHRLAEGAGGFDDPEIEEVILLTDRASDPPAMSNRRWTPAPPHTLPPMTPPIALMKQRE
ncbi:MAG: hypothetical protein ABI678_22990 [Kofleriaceae bacterium]